MRISPLVLLAVSASAMLLAAIAVGSHRHSTDSSGRQQRVEVDLGYEPNSDKGERVALRQISAGLLRHPEARHIDAQWNNSHFGFLHLDDETNCRGVYYDVTLRMLVYWDVGGEGGWTGVTPSMIERSTHSPHGFEAFKAYGCYEYP